mmetsp:Transcript_26741/g.89991  ORF Transcript_26741/g.89991 Transcript_26741/m.89991 type:complete len:294 (+) Transcript_26741:37-918(+)
MSLPEVPTFHGATGPLPRVSPARPVDVGTAVSGKEARVAGTRGEISRRCARREQDVEEQRTSIACREEDKALQRWKGAKNPFTNGPSGPCVADGFEPRFGSAVFGPDALPETPKTAVTSTAPKTALRLHLAARGHDRAPRPLAAQGAGAGGGLLFLERAPARGPAAVLRARQAHRLAQRDGDGPRRRLEARPRRHRAGPGGRAGQAPPGPAAALARRRLGQGAEASRPEGARRGPAAVSAVPPSAAPRLCFVYAHHPRPAHHLVDAIQARIHLAHLRRRHRHVRLPAHAFRDV